MKKQTHILPQIFKVKTTLICNYTQKAKPTQQKRTKVETQTKTHSTKHKPKNTSINKMIDRDTQVNIYKQAII